MRGAIALPSKREVLAFLGRFLGQIVIYLFPWPAMGKAYTSVVSAASDLIGSMAAVAPATIEAEPAWHLHKSIPQGVDPSWGLGVLLRNEVTGGSHRVWMDLRSLAYVPTMVLIALAVASPIWDTRRGFRVLGFGLALVHVPIALTIAMPVIFALGNQPGVKVFDLGSFEASALQVMYRTLVTPPGMAYAVPGLIWVLMMAATSKQ